MLDSQAKMVFPAASASLAATAAMEAATIAHLPGPHPVIKLTTQLNGPDNDNDTNCYEWNPSCLGINLIALHLSSVDNVV
jgi:hypothetical protein